MPWVIGMIWRARLHGTMLVCWVTWIHTNWSGDMTACWLVDIHEIYVNCGSLVSWCLNSNLPARTVDLAGRLLPQSIHLWQHPVWDNPCKKVWMYLLSERMLILFTPYGWIACPIHQWGIQGKIEKYPQCRWIDWDSFVCSWQRPMWLKCPAISCPLILLHICSQSIRLLWRA